MDRRTVLKGGLVLAATAHTAAYNGEIVKKAFDLQAWLDNAEPADAVRYHAARITEAMNLIRPDKAYRFRLDATEGYIHITGDLLA